MLRQAQHGRGLEAAADWPDRVRLPFAFDVPQMVADLAVLEQSDWTAHFVTQNYAGAWDVLPLRAQAGAVHPVMMIYSDPGVSDWVDTPFLDAAPYLREVIAAFQCPIEAVRLMRLSPGSSIHEHRDHDLDAAEGRARIHVPVTTNSHVSFLLNGLPVTMLPGEAWYLRLADAHAVHNGGTSDRVHLVIDAVVDQWLAGTIAAGSLLS